MTRSYGESLRINDLDAQDPPTKLPVIPSYHRSDLVISARMILRNERISILKGASFLKR